MLFTAAAYLSHLLAHPPLYEQLLQWKRRRPAAHFLSAAATAKMHTLEFVPLHTHALTRARTRTHCAIPPRALAVLYVVLD